jgi:hydroxymethylpyrimidine/phosphomethylpyrimidine kinase
MSAFDEEAVAEQARSVLEDVSVQVIKVGFCGNPENLSVIAEVATDYAEVPVVAYMPNLSWWEDEAIDAYLDAFRELILPQTTLLVGNHNTLWRWLLPDWTSEKALATRPGHALPQTVGVPYVLVTGINQPDQQVENALATAAHGVGQLRNSSASTPFLRRWRHLKRDHGGLARLWHRLRSRHPRRLGVF